MAEYIEREAVLAMCNRQASIEWNNKAAPISWAHGYETFAENVEAIPAADVVEVVRCWECKHRVDWHEEGYADDAGMCICATPHIVAPNHFCGYGERKDSKSKPS